MACRRRMGPEIRPAFRQRRSKKRRLTMGTVITAAVLLAIVGLAVRKMIRDKRSGKSLQCGCDCAKCGGCGHKG